MVIWEEEGIILEDMSFNSPPLCNLLNCTWAVFPSPVLPPTYTPYPFILAARSVNLEEMCLWLPMMTAPLVIKGCGRGSPVICILEYIFLFYNPFALSPQNWKDFFSHLGQLGTNICVLFSAVRII